MSGNTKHKLSGLLRAVLAAGLITCAAGTATAENLDETVRVTIDFAKVVKLDQPASTVIVGNSGIVEAAIDDLEFFDPVVATPAPEANLRVARIHGIKPNPFNPRTVISFEVPDRGRANLSIFDDRGRRVVTLVDGALPAGRHERTWIGVDRGGDRVASGVYYAVLRTLEARSIQKLVLTK